MNNQEVWLQLLVASIISNGTRRFRDEESAAQAASTLADSAYLQYKKRSNERFFEEPDVGYRNKPSTIA